MVVLRSGREFTSDSCSIGSKSSRVSDPPSKRPCSRSKHVSDPNPTGSKRLRPQIFSQLSYIRKSRDRIITLKQVEDGSRPHATEALKFYNKLACPNYELVEPGLITSVPLKTCFIHHIDFTAKKTDVPDAAEEMFFAELTTTCGVRCVKLCVCMGPRDSISGDKLNGCNFCSSYVDVQHPKDGEFTCGSDRLFRSAP